ncbi:hypothetical protein [Herbiconiux daphne]|uniref:Uncharacterized protein n=1 Tax=Herbiconiux daphne TaxID=2970914 RepID=A0ABT2H170_9MICO|nr:hypothetical protein [Herbiconiux daphne]MCS5733683.1 hypothetical protein [Herbiconiux daphne]
MALLSNLGPVVDRSGASAASGGSGASRAPVAPAVTWASPEAKLWVASRAGEYAGMVEYSAGHFLATNATGEPLGAFSDRPRAMSAVVQGIPRHRMPVTLLSNVALASAVVALSVTGLSLAAIAA